MRNIIIIGAGGIGREVANIIEEINEVNKQWNIIGFVDDNEKMQNKTLNGIPVLGTLECLESVNSDAYLVVAMGNCELKKNIVAKLNNKFSFATIIHPTVRVSKYINIGEGTIVYSGTILTVNTTIGNHVLISGNCGIGHDSDIGDYSSILWGTNLSGYDVIGKAVMLGVGVSVVQGIEIHDGSKVEAGTTIK